MKKVECSEQKFSEFRTHLEEQQAQISRQIAEAKEKIDEIKQQRKSERKKFREKEKLMKNEIEFHIDTARSTENKVEKFESELKKYKSVPKSEASAQTSFIVAPIEENG